MPPVHLGIRWAELFGKRRIDMQDDVRRSRWEEWKSLSRKSLFYENAEFWSTPEEECESCKHCESDWCMLESLPCTVNPLLTFSTNQIGIACSGVGFEKRIR